MSVARTLLSLTVGRTLARVVGVQHSGPTRVGRRSFVRNAALGAVGVNGALGSFATIRWLWANKTGDFGKELRVAAVNVPAVGAQPYVNTAGKFYLIHTDDGVMALYWKCVHLGCTVPPFNTSTETFNCPCHGSIYNYEGERIGGPAPRPLDYMPLTMDAASGDILVNTGDIQKRAAYDPAQTMKM